METEMSTVTENVVEVSHLTKNYGSGRGAFDVSLHVNEGEVFGFLGPNGAGKSTTIRHLMGFSRPDSGSTRIMGMETFTGYACVLSHVGYVPGEIALPAGLTGHEFIRMMQDMQGIHNRAQLEAMLSRFELADSVLCGETKRMSLGVKRKLAIVTAFMSAPAVLILDEPTSISLFDVISIIGGTSAFAIKFVILGACGIVGYIAGSLRFIKKDLPL